MADLTTKPYELSIWEDQLVTENEIDYYKEIKIAVIGSHIMNSPNKAFDLVLTESVNGEKILTFSLAYKYFDPIVEEVVNNPFVGYLINERKVKLFFNDKWYEFLIKECEENSDDYVFTYTARELFVLELSRVGYNIEIDPSLGNNQGTAIELGWSAIEGTDWEIDEENSDLLQQLVQEPLYQAHTVVPITVLNLDTNEEQTIEADSDIYIFYNYINNKDVSNLQFIAEADRENFIIDSNGVIQSTNYRIIDKLEITENNEIKKIEQESSSTIIILDDIYLPNQGYRLAYGPLTTYDLVKGRVVDIYEVDYGDGAQEIYHYKDYEYTTSDVITSFITNGDNFEIYDDGRLQGWDAETYAPEVGGALPTLQYLQLATRPQIASDKKLSVVKNFANIEGFIALKFKDILASDYSNTFFNSGFNDSLSRIDHITTGEEFVLRLRYYYANNLNDETLNAGAPTTTNSGIRAVVAKYELVDMDCYLDDDAATAGKSSKINAYKVLPNEVILDFDEAFHVDPNLISDGYLSENKTQYLIEGIVQTPSTKYVYVDKNDNSTQYVWDRKLNRFVEKTNDYADYYFTIAAAQCSYSNKDLLDSNTNIGIFLYTKDSNLVNKYAFISDIQLTRCYKISTNPLKVVTLGNIPTATSVQSDYYYLKPVDGATENEVNTYGSLDFLAKELGVNADDINQVYNGDCEKILSIEASHSNCFNILQNICETFECWLELNIEHEEGGTIKLNEEYNPIKKIAFKKYAGKDNFSGFKKGINLLNINRTIDSEEFVTKLIVDQVQSEYSDNGVVSIQTAAANPSSESYILDFSYYLNRGLITDREKCNQDLLEFYEQLQDINSQIKEINKQKDYLEMSLLKLSSNRSIISSYIDEAKKSYNDNIAKFYNITGLTFEEYTNKYHNVEEWAADDDDNLIDNESVLSIVGEIYAAATVINNYSGQLTNIDSEYKKIDLSCNGVREYDISVTCVPPIEEISGSTAKTSIVFSDYISGVEFKLVDEDNFVIYNTSPTDKIFNITSENSYKFIVFTNIPDEYKLIYYINNESKEAGDYSSFKIYDTEVGAVVNRRFKLIPNEEYASENLGYDKLLNGLYEEKKEIERNFYKKYSRFIQEGNWSSENYVDSELYYLDALQVSKQSSQPKVSYTINVAEVSEIEGLENYIFKVGDKTYIEDVDFFGEIIEIVDLLILKSPVREEVIVSEIEWHIDRPEENIITIQNYKTRFEDLFQRLSATIQTVQYNEATYAKTSSILDQNGLINSTLLANSLTNAGGVGFALTSNGTVQTTNEGLLVRDLTNPGNLVRIISKGIQVSSDGGQSWSTAINAEGISADKLSAGTINTQQIWLMDGDNPSFRWDKFGLNAYGLETKPNGAYDLKTYVRFDRYGLYGIKDGENYVASSLQDIKNNAQFGLTWDGFFIKNSYSNGYVSISSDNDFQVWNNGERIKIGVIEFDSYHNPTKYGININNVKGEPVFTTGDDGNIQITGTINALAGNFTGKVRVGDVNKDHIIIDGEDTLNPVIQSSNYQDGAGNGWIINGSGDATFSNVTVRGAIKTAVFEYEEIQAVGGAFLFRPSSTIRTARYEPAATSVTVTSEEGVTENINTYYYYDNGVKVYQDLILTVEKPLMFREDHWCKVSNYNSEEVAPTAASLSNYGLVHVYRVSDIDTEGRVPSGGTEDDRLPATYEITLQYGAALLDSVTIDKLVGGALIDFGATNGLENYGIGINSSDNYVNLPRRAISLFETSITPAAQGQPRVIYNYRAILGTLPTLQYEGSGAQVSSLYHNYLEGTQGIYTDNMYLGDQSHYIAFYTDKNDNNTKKLRIAGADIVFTYSDGQGGTTEKTLDDRIDEIEAGNGEDAAVLTIDSSEGNVFRDNQGSTDLTVTIFYGSNVITNSTQLTNIFGIGAYLEWEYKNNTNAWVTLLASDPRISDNGFTVSLNAEDVYNKANFRCKLII